MSNIWDNLLKSVSGVYPVKDKCVVLITNNKSAQDMIVDQLKSFINKKNQNSNMNSFVHTIGASGDNMSIYKSENPTVDDRNSISSDFGFGYGLFTIETSNDDQIDDSLKLHIYTILDDCEGCEEEMRIRQFEYYRSMVELYIKQDQFELSDLVIMPVLDFNMVGDASEWPIYLRRWLIDCFPSALNTESQKRINDKLLIEYFKQRSCEYLNSSSMNIKLNTGECDCPLGFHFTILVINPHSSKILNDRQCDYISQFLRLVCLKHGGSLCYLTTHEHNQLINTLQDTIKFTSSEMNIALRSKESNVQEPIFLNSRGLYIPLGSDNLDQISIVDDSTMPSEQLLNNWSQFVKNSSSKDTNISDEFLIRFKKSLASKGSSLSSDAENSYISYNIEENEGEEAGNKTDLILNDCVAKNVSLNEFLHSLVEIQKSNRILPDNL